MKRKGVGSRKGARNKKKIQTDLKEKISKNKTLQESKDKHSPIVGVDASGSRLEAFDQRDYFATASEDITKRKKAEEEIRMLSKFPAENPNPVVRLSKEGVILYSNAAGLPILADWKRGIGQDAPDQWCQLVHEVLDSRTKTEFEEEHRNRAFSFVLAPIVDAGYVNIYGLDITERKRAEEDLREARTYLENLIDYANAPIIVWDTAYRITRFNHAFERLTGHKAADVLGKPLEILFPEDSKEESLKHISRALSGEYWEIVEIPILRSDSSVRTVLWNSANIYGKDGTNVVATIAQGQDITQRKLAEQALRDSQIDLNRAQAVAKTGSWRLDMPRDELLWSDETYRIFGIPKGTPMTYETFLSTVYPDDREYVDQKWKAALRGEPYDVEHRIIVNGKIKWVREKAELEFDKDGAIMSGFGTAQEITELKDMQARLEEYSKHLEQLVDEKTQKLNEAERMATIGETAGMVGHDIRNPLQSIEGAVYLAREELKSLPSETQEKKELNEILEIIENQTRYIDHIVADLQDFARTPMVQLRETDIQELINEALSVVEISDNIEVSTTIQEGIQKLMIDPTCIKRVLINLIENAVQSMPNGGKLTVKAFIEPEAAYIAVEDTGSGISAEDKPKVFTPLFTTKAKGQGFGLPVCKKLVEAHHGEITFESEAGKGTTFKIKLPLSKEASQK